MAVDNMQRQELGNLECEVEALEEALCNQELALVRGYIVTIYPGRNGRIIASCPTLHASVEALDRAEAVRRLGDAMSAVEGTFSANGIDLPPKDTDAKCLDCA